MKAIKILIGVLAGILAVLFIGSFFIGTNFRASQTQVMKAAPEAVYQQLITPEQWKKWSFWALEDPTTTFTYNDTKSGPGAAYSWKSEKMGNGTLTVSGVEPGRYVVVALDFDGKGKAVAEYIISSTPDGGSEVVSALNSETSSFIDKWMSRIVGRPMLVKAFKATMENMDNYIAENPAPPAPPELPAGDSSEVPTPPTPPTPPSK